LAPTGTVIDKSGNIYVAGMYYGEYHPGTDFDPGPLTEYRDSGIDGGQFLMMFPPDGNW